MMEGIANLFKRKQQCLKEIELSEEAKTILNSPMVQDFFAKAEANAYKAWQETPDDALEARERLYLMNGMLRNFRQYFEGFVANGQFAERTLEEIIKNEEANAKRR